MSDMNDVRRALWRAYKKAEEKHDGFYGKSSDGYCELRYPTIWECETEEEFLVPSGIMVYSYALGPSRSHYVNKHDTERILNYYTWEGPDIYETAIRMIESWGKDDDG